jgi:hypothetical protein
MGDPLWPAVDVVAVIGEPTSARRARKSVASFDATEKRTAPRPAAIAAKAPRLTKKQQHEL